MSKMLMKISHLIKIRLHKLIKTLSFFHFGVELYLSRGKLAVSDICVLCHPLIQRRNKVSVPLTMQFGSQGFSKYEIYSWVRITNGTLVSGSLKSSCSSFCDNWDASSYFLLLAFFMVWRLGLALCTQVKFQ